MSGEQLKQAFRGVSMIVVGVLGGAGLAFVLTQYPGIMELRINSEESYIMVNGSPMCEMITERKDEQRNM